MSIEHLAEASSLDAALVREIEHGACLVSTAKLDRIAATLGLDAFALYDGREAEQSLVVLPRHASRVDFQAADLPVLRRALERASALNNLSALLAEPNLRSQFSPAAPGDQPAKDGYHRARMVRRALGLTQDPIGTLEVLLAERFAVPVVSASLATSRLLAAAVRSSTGAAAAVVLNRTADDAPAAGTAQASLVDRVSICHELCHVLFDERTGTGIDVILDDPPRSGQDKSPIEQRAGAFAAELLIPVLGLTSFVGDAREIERTPDVDTLVDSVREHFGTPAELTVNHLYNHGYVARIDEFRRALIESAQQRPTGALSAAFTSDADAARRVLEARTKAAHEGGLISDGMARASLQIAPGESLPWESGAA